jgi:hypothetical protein
VEDPEHQHLGQGCVNKFDKFYRNLMDSVLPNFKISDFIVYRFETFEKIKN